VQTTCGFFVLAGDRRKRRCSANPMSVPCGRADCKPTLKHHGLPQGAVDFDAAQFQFIARLFYPLRTGMSNGASGLYPSILYYLE
jgi:hypothetical protein